MKRLISCMLIYSNINLGVNNNVIIVSKLFGYAAKFRLFVTTVINIVIFNRRLSKTMIGLYSMLSAVGRHLSCRKILRYYKIRK